MTFSTLRRAAAVLLVALLALTAASVAAAYLQLDRQGQAAILLDRTSQPTATAMATSIPTGTSTNTPTPTLTPTPTPIDTDMPTLTPTPTPIDTDTPTLTPTWTPTAIAMSTIPPNFTPAGVVPTPYVTVTLSALSVNVGDTVTVTVDTNIGIPEYHLFVMDAATDIEQSEIDPFFDPARPPIKTDSFGSMTLTAMRAGTVYFKVHVIGEVRDCLNCDFYIRGRFGRSDNVVVTAP